MPYVLRPKFTVSRRPYAIDPTTLRTHTVGVEVDAVWAGRKDGRNVVTVGVLRLWDPQRRPPSDDIDVQLARADHVYGGTWEARWDGRTFLVEPTSPLNRDPVKLQKVREALAAFLDALPAVPPGLRGWYYPENIKPEEARRA